MFPIVEQHLKNIGYGLTTSSIMEDNFEDYEILFKQRRNTMFYLLNVKDMKIVAKFKTETEASRVGQKSKFTYLILSEETDLHQLTLKLLRQLQKNLGEKGAVDNKKVACPRLWAAIERLKLAPPKQTKTRGPNKDSKISSIRRLFEKNDQVPRDAIMKATGWDVSNVSVAMSILKNPLKTKNTLKTTYDRKTQTFSLVKEDR